MTRLWSSHLALLLVAAIFSPVAFAGAQKDFSDMAADANGDGKVSLTELRRYHREVEQLLDDWETGWSSNNKEKLLSLFTEDCIYEDVPFQIVNHGQEELGVFIDSVFAAVPDLNIEVTSRFVSGHRAVMEWSMSGTHQGDLPGLPATGNRFQMLRGVTVLELKQGKIQRNSDYWDAATLMRQVGLLPTDEEN